MSSTPRIPKAGKAAAKSGRASRSRPPLDVRLTVRVKFGDADDDTVTMMDDRSVPMVDSVFKYRDRILRGLSVILVKAAAAQPRIGRELAPLVAKIGPAARRLRSSR